jgi:hypothetical protein
MLRAPSDPLGRRSLTKSNYPSSTVAASFCTGHVPAPPPKMAISLSSADVKLVGMSIKSAMGMATLPTHAPSPGPYTQKTLCSDIPEVHSEC